jgi:hypothetical protein
MHSRQVSSQQHVQCRAGQAPDSKGEPHRASVLLFTFRLLLQLAVSSSTVLQGRFATSHDLQLKLRGITYLHVQKCLQKPKRASRPEVSISKDLFASCDQTHTDAIAVNTYIYLALALLRMKHRSPAG